jgi:predicted alpha/beta superfamily hydrolase
MQYKNFISFNMEKSVSCIKKHLVLFVSLLFASVGFAQTNKVVIGTIDSLQSKILGEQRKVWVYVPEGANIADPSVSQKYPVVYLLDGDAHFYSVVGIIQQLSQVNGNMICPEMIVVGIPNTDRTRDLTPTHTDIDPFTKDSAAFLKTSGGGENFIAFMEKELMPFIESKYPIAPYKMLIGHSLGGLMGMQTFVHHPHLFNSYICIDPSMWYDDKKLLNETKTFLKNTKLEGKSLYLGIANTMDEGMDRSDKIHQRRERGRAQNDFVGYTGLTDGKLWQQLPPVRCMEPKHNIFLGNPFICQHECNAQVCAIVLYPDFAIRFYINVNECAIFAVIGFPAYRVKQIMTVLIIHNELRLHFFVRGRDGSDILS